MIMATGGQEDVAEQYTCPICCEVFRSPISIRTCNHNFCRLCVERVPTNADGAMSCPICRASFVSTDLKWDRALERDLATITTTCTICGAKCKLSQWNEHCATHPITITQSRGTSSTAQKTSANRSTFKCPLCPLQHLSSLDLLVHVNQKHSHSDAPVVCPICASMPWGVANQLSQNFVGHLNARHKFEYDTYVDYQKDEEDTLQAILRVSLIDK